MPLNFKYVTVGAKKLEELTEQGFHDPVYENDGTGDA